MTKVEDWLKSQLAVDIWNKKYRFENESFDQWLSRVSGGDKDIRKLILDKKFLFGGRILANRGTGVGTSSNCFVIGTDDSIESIYDTAKQMATIFKAGGGVGVDLSTLAPAGAKINNPARTTSGSVSFIDLFTTTASTIGTNGRRAALMLSLSCDHPDIKEFIELKTDVNKATSANLSIKITDDFMRAVQNDEDWFCAFTRKETGECISKVFKAKDLFEVFCNANYDYGEPGMIFWDNVNRNNMYEHYYNYEYANCNPCLAGDTLLTIIEDDKPVAKRICELEGRTDVSIVAFDGRISHNNKVWSNGVKDVVKVKTSLSKEIVCTPDHRFMLFDGSECLAKDLKGKEIISFCVPTEEFCYALYCVHTGEFCKDTVISVTDAGQEEVFDFTETKTHWGIANGYVVHNCGEQFLPDGGACLLGSMNLSEYVRPDLSFDYTSFSKDVGVCIKALDTVLSEGIDTLPLEIQKAVARDWRQVGLGIMGLGDMLIKMNIPYGSEESLDLCDTIGGIMAKSAITASIKLGMELDSFPNFDAESTKKSSFYKAHMGDNAPVSMRNSQVLCVAPTGSLSTMLGVSGGIEPLFALEYNRTTKSLNGKDTTYKVTPDVVSYARDRGMFNGLVCAADIDYKDRIAMQAVWQKHIDNAISSTINLPKDFPKENIGDLYMLAWKSGLKGVTVFRDGCKREGILTTKTDEVIDDELIGYKRKIVTGCGNQHICVYADKSGNLKELFCIRGSSGGCLNTLNGLSRMVSLSLRNNVPLDAIVDQLLSCGVCSSYATRRATHKDVSKGTCCPSAIAYALMDIRDSIKKDIQSTEHKDTSPKCPECGSALSSTNGCVVCTSCGYSRCG